MRTRFRFLLLSGLVLTVIVGATLLTTDQTFDFKDDSDLNGGDGNGNGDNGSLNAESSLTVYDEDGNIQQVGWIQGLGVKKGVVDPAARGVTDPITLAASACLNTPGFHWDYGINDCLPNVEAPSPDDGVVDKEDPVIPQVDVITISDDFLKIEFTLEWAEIEGVKISKETVYIKIKARVLLKDETWSSVLDSLEIKYWKSEFKLLEESGDYFKIRCDSSTMVDDDLTIYKDDILSKASYAEIKQPLSIRFYYYAKGDPTDGSATVESNTINKLVIVEGDLGASLGIDSMLMFAPIAMVQTRRRF